MKRTAIYLPILGLGVPLLITLLVASTRKEDRLAAPTIKQPEAVAASVLMPVPRSDGLAQPHWAERGPVGLLKQSLERYGREVHGYRCLLYKQERLAHQLQPPELIEVFFRESPYSVLMRWRRGARKAEAALFVAGENRDKMLARPNGFLAKKVVGDVVERDVDGPEARQSGRYPLTEFGIRKATARALAAWETAQRAGVLHVEYLGQLPVAELGGRVCHKLRRMEEQPTAEGVQESILYLDRETLLQTGTVLRGRSGELIAEYYFRDLQLNPVFSATQFQAGALQR